MEPKATWQPHPADAAAFRALAAVLYQRAKHDPEARGKARAAALAAFASELRSPICSPFRDAVAAVPIAPSPPMYRIVRRFTNLARDYGLPYPQLWGELLADLRVYGPAEAAANVSLLGGPNRLVREALAEAEGVVLHLAPAGGEPWRYALATPDDGPNTINLRLPDPELPRQRRQADLITQIAPLFKQVWPAAKRTHRDVLASVGTVQTQPAAATAGAPRAVELLPTTIGPLVLATHGRPERARRHLVAWLLDQCSPAAARGGGERPSWRQVAHWWALSRWCGCTPDAIAARLIERRPDADTIDRETQRRLAAQIAQALSRVRALAH